MPINDPERRKVINKAWRERTNTKEYMRWLYDRRNHRFWKAEKFDFVLDLIASGKYVGSASEIATLWLAEAKQRELQVGLFFDHEHNQPSNEPSRKGGPRPAPLETEDA